MNCCIRNEKCFIRYITGIKILEFFKLTEGQFNTIKRRIGILSRILQGVCKSFSRVKVSLTRGSSWKWLVDARGACGRWDSFEKSGNANRNLKFN